MIRADEHTRFIGRQRELAELARLFADDARLVTVVGTSGTGKTRLARRFAASDEVARSHLQTWFCDLSAARSESELCATVAQALDVPLTAARGDPAAVLSRALGSRGRVFLVLDNLEQVVEPARSTVKRWLADAPDLRVLSTSRAPLALAEEQRFELDPLSVPAPEARRASEVLEAEAAELFADRAKLADAGFELDDERAAAVAELVRRLDGIPLAIELCAARVGLLSPAQLLELLASRFETLVARPGARLTPRQATLRGAIDWSWELLEEWQRSALAQLSVFRGSFDLDAVRAVLSLGDGAPGGALWPVQVLQSLLDHSLVRSTSSSADEKRFVLLMSIRDYAEEKLSERADREATLARHTRHFLTLGPELENAALARGDVRALDRLALVSGDLLAVLERALAAEDSTTAARAIVSLHPMYAVRGPLSPHVERLGGVLSLCEKSPPPVALYAKVLGCSGWAKSFLGAAGDGIPDYQTAIALTAEGEAPEIRAQCAARVGVALAWQREDAEAVRAFELAFATLEHVDDRRTHGIVHTEHGILLGRLARLEEAHREFEAALEAFRESGARRDEAAALINLGLRHVEWAQLEDGRERYEAALDIVREVRERRLESAVLAQLGWIAMEEGDAPRARGFCEQALEVARDVGILHWEGMALGYLGHVALLEGQDANAAQSLERATELLKTVGDARHQALYLAARAAALAGAGQTSAAEKCLTNARELVAESGRSRDAEVVDTYGLRVQVAAARARGDDTEATRLCAEARAIPEEDPPPPDELRLARALLKLALGSARRTLRVDQDAYRFVAPDGSAHDISRRQNLRRVLWALVDQRMKSPGANSTVNDLFSAGWPGERARVEAAVHRVHVAVATLRKLGLGDVLLTRDGGYLLDPSAEIVIG